MARNNTAVDPFAFIASPRMTEEEIAAAHSTAMGRLKRGVIAQDVPPEVLLGWSVGKPLDFSGYRVKQEDGHDLDYHRADEFYDMKNPACAAIVESIIAAGRVDALTVAVAVDEQGRQRIAVAAGATRSMAMALAVAADPEKFKTVSIQFERGSLSDVRALMVASNMEGRTNPLAPLDLAKAIRALRATGMKQDEVCERLGKKKTWHNELRKIEGLLDAPAEVQAAIRERGLGQTAAIELAGMDSEKAKAIVSDPKADVTAGGLKKAAKRARRDAKADDDDNNAAPETSDAASSNGTGGKTKKQLLDAIATAKGAKGAKKASEAKEGKADTSGGLSRMRPQTRIASTIEWLNEDVEAFRRTIPAKLKMKGEIKELMATAEKALKALSDGCVSVQEKNRAMLAGEPIE